MKLNQVMIPQSDVTGTFLSSPTVKFSFSLFAPTRFLLFHIENKSKGSNCFTIINQIKGHTVQEKMGFSKMI